MCRVGYVPSLICAELSHNFMVFWDKANGVNGLKLTTSEEGYQAFTPKARYVPSNATARKIRNLHIYVCLFVLRFYGPVNPMGSCRAWSVYLITRLLGRLSPLSG